MAALATVLARFAERRLWGSVTAHYTAGRLAHVTEHVSVRPSADRLLAAAVNKHPEVAEAILTGETCEFVFARFKGGQMALLAKETLHVQEKPDDAGGTTDRAS